MQERTLARRYARGLFEKAREHNLLPQIEQDISLLAPLLSERGVIRFFNNPCVNFVEKRRILQEALGQGCTAATVNLLALLAQRRRMKAFPEVVRVFRALLDEFRRIARVKAKLAAPTSEAVLASLKARLSAAIGRSVELEPEMDESLLGGAVLVLNDSVLDGSVRGAIERLRERMRQS